MHVSTRKASEAFLVSILQVKASGPGCPEVYLANEEPVFFSSESAASW